MRLLLIEDDLTIASFVSKGLKEAGFVVEHASEGKTGLHMALTSCYDAAVIDIMLPGLDGLAIIDELRQRRIKLPVIILSAKRSIDERVEGLEAGGDDYLTKPFSFSELLARIQALDPPGERYTRAHQDHRWGTLHRSAYAGGHARRQKNRPSTPGVPFARISRT